jgi:hypothetical protein
MLLTRIDTPQFWSNTSRVEFNFTPFVDFQSGIRTYSWGVGTKPGVADVIPMQVFNGTMTVRAPTLYSHVISPFCRLFYLSCGVLTCCWGGLVADVIPLEGFNGTMTVQAL